MRKTPWKQRQMDTVDKTQLAELTFNGKNFEIRLCDLHGNVSVAMVLEEVLDLMNKLERTHNNCLSRWYSLRKLLEQRMTVEQR